MFIPIWALVISALVFLVLLRLALRGRGADDMLEQQRRSSDPLILSPERVEPKATAGQRSKDEHRALLARPDLRPG